MYVDIFNSLLTPQIKTSAKKKNYRVNLTCLPDFLSFGRGEANDKPLLSTKA